MKMSQIFGSMVQAFKIKQKIDSSGGVCERKRERDRRVGPQRIKRGVWVWFGGRGGE
jgi:hypothetical protein